MFSINENVTGYVDELLNREEELNLKSYFLENQATVIDCGVEARGSIGAALLYAAISLGGLGKASLVPGIIDGYYLQFAQAWIDRPAIACLCSQKAAWKIRTEGFTGTAFGPARAIAQKPKAIYAALNYSDDAENAVVNIEAGALPSAREIDFIAKQCSTDPECVVALVARPNSIVGSVVNSTRATGWTMNRLFQAGYDTMNITSASSAVPIAPLHADEAEFIGMSFDSIAYYGMVSLYAKEKSDLFRGATPDGSKSYGKSFRSLLKDVQGDCSRVDAAMFAPARLMVNGHDGTLSAYGKLDPSMLLRSYGLKA
jgi:methenyltetrahydromethanopterin cyclohydrolase